MELLCKHCLYSDDCYILYCGDSCQKFYPLHDNEEKQSSVIYRGFGYYFQGCSTLEEHNKMEELQEIYESLKGSDLELEEYPF